MCSRLVQTCAVKNEQLNNRIVMEANYIFCKKQQKKTQQFNAQSEILITPAFRVKKIERVQRDAQLLLVTQQRRSVVFLRESTNDAKLEI